MDKANQARTRILRFGDEARRGLPHTQEHWEDVLRDIDAYEKYCDSHKEYINSKAVSTIAFLRARYAEHLEQNGAVVTETFNKKVNVLIAKDITGNSSKITKAKEQGCQILSLDQAKIKFHQ